MTSVRLTFRPVHQWPKKPTPAHQRKDSQFRASYSSTLDLLDKELFHMDARNVIVQAFFTLDQIRNDGWPKATSRPSEPGVILSFETQSGPLSFPCDTYHSFDENLRAIALSLQALRAVDRYGVTQHAEQYKGFTPLPSGEAKSREDAAHFVAVHSDIDYLKILQQAEWRDAAVRAAAQKLHPDKPTGSHELFVKLQEAKEVLSHQ